MSFHEFLSTIKKCQIDKFKRLIHEVYFIPRNVDYYEINTSSLRYQILFQIAKAGNIEMFHLMLPYRAMYPMHNDFKTLLVIAARYGRTKLMNELIYQVEGHYRYLAYNEAFTELLNSAFISPANKFLEHDIVRRHINWMDAFLSAARVYDYDLAGKIIQNLDPSDEDGYGKLFIELMVHPGSKPNHCIRMLKNYYSSFKIHFDRQTLCLFYNKSSTYNIELLLEILPIDTVEWIASIVNDRSHRYSDFYKKDYKSTLTSFSLIFYFDWQKQKQHVLYKRYNDIILHHIRHELHTIAVSLTDLPMPLLIEILEECIPAALYVPLIIKWNMFFAIKHSPLYKSSYDE